MADDVEGGLEVRLEGLEVAGRGDGRISGKDSWGRELRETYGGDIFWDWKTILESSRKTLE